MGEPISERLEWLEADGLGGFASGTASGIRARRYHALLLSAATPPTGRHVLVAGMDVTFESDGKSVALSSQRYAPGVIYPDGASRLLSFTNDPWPTWRYHVSDSIVIEQSLFVSKGLPITVLRWRSPQAPPGSRLSVRLFLAGRDYHSMHHENAAFRFQADVDGTRVSWSPYDGVQSILAAANAVYSAEPDWYRRFLYSEEERRGLDATEDLATPGRFEWDASHGDAVLILAAKTAESTALLTAQDPLAVADSLEERERSRRRAFTSELDRAADAYIVRRGTGATIVAGYPWFTDWGRDTFIAIRGLCLATGRYREARQILLQWAAVVSEGMLPNRFPDGGDVPEFNAVDASLWYIVAAHEWLNRVGATDTAYAERSALWMSSIDGNWENPANSAKEIAWVRETFNQIAPYSTGTTYTNFTSQADETAAALASTAYGANMTRLRLIKAKYDPNNFFRLNANIAPASAASV